MAERKRKKIPERDMEARSFAEDEKKQIPQTRMRIKVTLTAVARSGLISLTPILEKMAVKAAQRAAKRA